MSSSKIVLIIFVSVVAVADNAVVVMKVEDGLLRILDAPVFSVVAKSSCPRNTTTMNTYRLNSGNEQ